LRLPVALAIVLAGLLAPTIAMAHPHIWIQQLVRLVAKDGRYTHVEIEWRFDPFSSEIEIPLIDEDHDGKISASEAKLLAGEMMPEFKKVGYLSWINNRRQGFPSAQAAGILRAHRRSGELRAARLGSLGRRQCRHADAGQQTRR